MTSLFQPPARRRPALQVTPRAAGSTMWSGQTTANIWPSPSAALASSHRLALQFALQTFVRLQSALSSYLCGTPQSHHALLLEGMSVACQGDPKLTSHRPASQQTSRLGLSKGVRCRRWINAATAAIEYCLSELQIDLIARDLKS